MKKFEHKTKDEKRRVLLNEKTETKQARIVKYGSDSVAVVAKDVNRRFIAAFLALVFAISCIIIGFQLSVKAADGKDYESAYEITFSSGKYTVDQNAIDSGLANGSVCKYADSQNKYHAFTIPNDFTVYVGDTMTLDSSTSPESVILKHDPRIAVGGETLEKLVDHVQDNGNGTFTIDSANQNQALSPDITYWYLDSSDNKTVYKFTPTKEYGYKAVELREEDEVIGANSGTIEITLNKSTPSFDFSGVQWRRHAIYERASSLMGNNVYLIVGVENNKRYMLSYDNSTHWQGDYYDQDMFSSATCSNTNKGENVYNMYYGDETENLILASASSENDTTKQVLYANIDDSSPTVYQNYFDGFDGTVYQGQGDEVYDPYVYSEFSTYTTKIGQWFFNLLTGGISGLPLRAYDGNTNYYTTNKAFGTYGTAHRDEQTQVFIKYFCQGKTGPVAHYQGMIWEYANGKLYNNNNRAGVVDGYPYLNFSTTEEHLTDGLYNFITGKYAIDVYCDGFFCNKESTTGEIEIYQMKNVYDKEIIDDNYDIEVDEIKEATVPTIALDNATVFLTYDGADSSEKQFTTALSLKDDTNQPVTGTYPGTLNGVGHDFIFENGNCTESIALKDSQSFIITHIPFNYSISVATNAEELAHCQANISQKDSGEGNPSTVIESGDFVKLTTDKEIDISIIRDTTFQLEVVAPEGVADAYAEFCGYYDSAHEQGTQTSAYFKGTYGGDVGFVGDNETFPVISDDKTYVFGLPTTTNIEIPDGYGAATSVNRIRIFTRVVAGFQDGVNPDKYTVSAVLNDSLNLYTSSEEYTATGDGWRTNNTTGTDQLLNLKTDNKLKIIYQGIAQNVTVRHFVDGSEEDKAEASNLKIKLSLLSSENGTGVPLTVEDTAGNTYVFDSNGICTTELGLVDNGSVTLKIPYGYYLKAEDAGDYSEKYSTLYNESQIVKVDEGNSILVTHKRNAHSVTITENVTGNYANDLDTFQPVVYLVPRSGDVPEEGMTLNGTVWTKVPNENKLTTIIEAIQGNGSSATLAVPAGWTLFVEQTDDKEYNVDSILYATNGSGNQNYNSETGIPLLADVAITINNDRSNITIEGIGDGSDSTNVILSLLASMAVISGGAGVAYVYRKKDDFGKTE